MYVEGRSRGGENIGAILNMVLISVILDGFVFKHKINKTKEWKKEV